MPDQALDVSVVMPCLDEEATVGRCVESAWKAIRAAGLQGEVIVADNGSADASVARAKEAGAIVVAVPERGYGRAISAGLAAARGRWILFGDSDASYDFSALPLFAQALEKGADLALGCRFPAGGGRIAAGAMPALHRLVGNPALSAAARLLFRTGTRDVYCGLRAGRAAHLRALGLRAPGMELAAEMVVRSAQTGGRIAEVPITLDVDGRGGRGSHLRRWRDGLRTLALFARLLFAPEARLATMAILALGAAAVAIRLAASCGDFGFDEVWSIARVRDMTSLADVWWVAHDNSHLLCSAFLYLQGDLRDPWLYRVPALLASIATVPFAWGIARRRGQAEAFVALLFATVAVMLVQYGTEARGYAFATLSLFVAVRALRGAPPPASPQAALYQLAAALGPFGHLTFFYAWPALVAHDAWTRFRRGTRGLELARDVARMQALPASTHALILFGWVARMQEGGMAFVFSKQIASSLAAAFAFPFTTPFAFVAAGLLVLLAGVMLVPGVRASSDKWILFFVSLAMPAIHFLLRAPTALAPRYFLLQDCLLLLLLADLAGAAWRSGGGRRGLAVAGIAVFVLGNLARDADLLEHGRGRTTDALRIVQREAKDPAPAVFADDLRSAMLLEFALRRSPSLRVTYAAPEEWTARAPEWILASEERALLDDGEWHSIVRLGLPDGAVRSILTDHVKVAWFGPGREYELVARLPASELTGWTTVLFRQRDPGAGRSGGP